MRVHFQVVEGSRRRTQVFEGIVLKRQGSGARETFTVRKQSFGVGVERTFPLHSPKIEKLEIAARGDVRRAKLYYLRGRIGKAARVAERRWGIDEEMISTATAAEEPEAVDAEGVDDRRGRGRRARRGAGGRGSRRRAPPRRRRPGQRRRQRQSRTPAARLPSRARRRGDRRAGVERDRDHRGGRRGGPRRGLGCRRGRAIRRLRQGLGLKPRIPKPESTAGGLVELVVIVALALGLALAAPGVLVKPYQIPSQSMEPTLDVGQRVLVNRFLYHFTDPSIGDIVVFHPPAGADSGTECGAPHPPSQACDSPTEGRVEPELHQADRRRARRHAQRPRRPPGGQRRREDATSPTRSPAAAAPPAICRIRSRFRPTITS